MSHNDLVLSHSAVVSRNKTRFDFLWQEISACKNKIQPPFIAHKKMFPSNLCQLGRKPAREREREGEEEREKERCDVMKCIAHQ